MIKEEELGINWSYHGLKTSLTPDKTCNAIKKTVFSTKLTNNPYFTTKAPIVLFFHELLLFWWALSWRWTWTIYASQRSSWKGGKCLIWNQQGFYLFVTLTLHKKSNNKTRRLQEIQNLTLTHNDKISKKLFMGSIFPFAHDWWFLIVHTTITITPNPMDRFGGTECHS